MRSALRHLSIATVLVSLVVAIGACGGGESEKAESGDGAKGRVLHGARHDFATAVEGPAGFTACFLLGLRRELSPDSLEHLKAVRAERGTPAAARSLNHLGAPIGDECGGRRWVPELTDAAGGLQPDH